MKRNNIVRTALAVVAVAAIGLAPLTAAAAQIRWDQEKVSELTQQLADAVSALRKTVMKEPQMRGGAATNRRAADAYLGIMKGLEQSTRQLARKTAAGEGREQTLGVAKKIAMLVRDAKQEGRKLFTPQWTQEKIEPAAALFQEIRPYYSEKSLTAE